MQIDDIRQALIDELVKANGHRETSESMAQRIEVGMLDLPAAHSVKAHKLANQLRAIANPINKRRLLPRDIYDAIGNLLGLTDSRDDGPELATLREVFEQYQSDEIELTDLQVLALLAAAPVDRGTPGDEIKAGHVQQWEREYAAGEHGKQMPRRQARVIIARVLGLPAPPSDDARLVVRVGWATEGQAKDGGTEPDPGVDPPPGGPCDACASDRADMLHLPRCPKASGGPEPDPGASDRSDAERWRGAVHRNR